MGSMAGGGGGGTPGNRAPMVQIAPLPALTTVSVIGAGAYGTALANAVATSGRNVILYARDAAAAERIATSRLNPKLPGIRLHDDVVVTQDIARAEADIDLLHSRHTPGPP